MFNYKSTDFLRESVKLINNALGFDSDLIERDESCSVSLASLLVLTNARLMCASITSNSLLISTNLIKGNRFADFIVASLYIYIGSIEYLHIAIIDPWGLLL